MFKDLNVLEESPQLAVLIVFLVPNSPVTRTL